MAQFNIQSGDKVKLIGKTIIAASASPSLNLTSGLLAFYKLDDLIDSSGNGNTLTNNGNVTFSSGKIGNAADFDGSSYLSVDLGNRNEVTISAWAKSSNTLHERPVFATSTFNISIRNGGTPFWGCYDGASVTESSVEVVTEQWYHLLMVVSDSGCRFYVNGVQFGDTLNPNVIGQPIRLGEATDGNYFTGQIDAVSIWNRALSDSEVAALYNSGAGIELP